MRALRYLKIYPCVSFALLASQPIAITPFHDRAFKSYQWVVVYRHFEGEGSRWVSRSGLRNYVLDEASSLSGIAQQRDAFLTSTCPLPRSSRQSDSFFLPTFWLASQALPWTRIRNPSERVKVWILLNRIELSLSGQPRWVKHLCCRPHYAQTRYGRSPGTNQYQLTDTAAWCPDWVDAHMAHTCNYDPTRSTLPAGPIPILLFLWYERPTRGS